MLSGPIALFFFTIFKCFTSSFFVISRVIHWYTLPLYVYSTVKNPISENTPETHHHHVRWYQLINPGKKRIRTYTHRQIPLTNTRNIYPLVNNPHAKYPGHIPTKNIFFNNLTLSIFIYIL